MPFWDHSRLFLFFLDFLKAFVFPSLSRPNIPSFPDPLPFYWDGQFGVIGPSVLFAYLCVSLWAQINEVLQHEPNTCFQRLQIENSTLAVGSFNQQGMLRGSSSMVDPFRATYRKSKRSLLYSTVPRSLRVYEGQAFFPMWRGMKIGEFSPQEPHGKEPGGEIVTSTRGIHADLG